MQGYSLYQFGVIEGKPTGGKIAPTQIRVKNSENPCCINLMLTNFKPSFMKAKVFEIGISDHHKINSITMKRHFTRENP